MLIDCVSDLHGTYPEMEGGDLLIVAGDLTARDTQPQYYKFFDWINKLKYRKKVVIAGNHDGLAEHNPWFMTSETFEYLCDSGTEFEGLKIWGSPWTPQFCKWHFMLPKGEEIKKKWDLIPTDTDILVTHGPAWGMLDTISSTSCGKLDRFGCEELKVAVERVKPKLHVFGHIHGGYGQKVSKEGVICVNAAHMNEDYKPVNKPIRIVL